MTFQRTNSSRSLVVRGLLLACSVSLAACLNSPRNGQEGDSYDVQFSGYTMYSGEFEAMRQWNYHSASWFDLARGTRATTTGGYRDSSGNTWYAFSATIPMATASGYWHSGSKNGSQRRIKTKISGFSSARAAELYSFDADADSCMNAQTTGLDVIRNCRSSKSPAAEVFLPCGTSTGWCCTADDVPSEERCDRGRLCSNSKCSTPAGGLDQPCNVNLNTSAGGGKACNSGLTCVAGTCRDDTMNKLPLLTLDLRVTTCDDSSWNLSADNSTMWVNLGTDDFHIEVPGTELRNNTTDTFGLSPHDIGKLGDIEQLDINIGNRNWCVSKVELIANDNVVFKKTFSAPEYLAATNPFHVDNLLISGDELKTYWTTHSSTTHCDGPEQLSGAAIQRKVIGILGESIATNDEIKGDFDQGGYVRVTRVNSSTMKVKSRFMASKFINYLGTQDLRTDIEFTMTYGCKDGAITSSMSPVTVTDVDGSLGYDLLALYTFSASDLVVEAFTEMAINASSGSLAGGLDNVIDDLPACPSLTVDTAAPPNLTVGYPAPVTPALVNICQ